MNVRIFRPLSNVQRRNFTVLVIQGGATSLAAQLASINAILPFLCVALGGSFLAASLLLPLYAIGTLIGTTTAPRLIGARWTERTWLFAGSFGKCIAVLIVTAAAEFLLSEPFAIDLVYSALAIAIGLIVSIRGSAFNDVLASTVDIDTRPKLLFTQAALGGVLGLLVAITAARFFGTGPDVTSYLGMQWLAGAVLVVAAFLTLFIKGDAAAGRPRRHARTAATLEIGFRALRNLTWYRSYVIGQLVLLSVVLSTTFFSIHAAATHPKNDNPTLIVGFVAGGAVLGAFVWHQVLRRFGYRVLFLLGTAVCIGAVALNLIEEALDVPDTLWFDGFVIMAATQASQAVIVGRQAFLIDHLRTKGLDELVTFSKLLITIISVPVAALIGALASISAPLVALTVLLAFNFLAIIGAARLQIPDADARHRHDDDDNPHPIG
jgi:Na+/melibiose symporter-like transporter